MLLHAREMFTLANGRRSVYALMITTAITAGLPELAMASVQGGILSLETLQCLGWVAVQVSIVGACAGKAVLYKLKPHPRVELAVAIGLTAGLLWLAHGGVHGMFQSVLYVLAVTPVTGAVSAYLIAREIMSDFDKLASGAAAVWPPSPLSIRRAGFLMGVSR